MLTHRQRRATVMAIAGSPSMPLFSHVKGVDTGMRRHDGWGQPKSLHQRWFG
jgi:hypothetical protein